MRITLPRLVATTAILGALAIVAPGFSLVAADPAGNNGTIKIDGTLIRDVPNNEPHVGCDFEIEFFGFDADATAWVTFEGQPPSGTVTLIDRDEVPLSKGDHSGGGSARGFDGRAFYDLTENERLKTLDYHPKQGYHIKLTIEADGSRGNDVKHKVFWVEGCGPGDSVRSN